MFDVKNLTIEKNGKIIIENLSFTLNRKDKLAIIGEEGNGKSTLLKALLGICEYATVSGQINNKGNTIGYLEQSLNEENFHKKVYDYLFSDNDDYYNKINDFFRLIESLKIAEDILEQTMNSLSGGEKVKISILKLLLEDYDILFLDEPTNDLDIETLEWLEDFINKCDKPIVYVSHDETLLSRTANMILHIEQLKKKTECKHTFLKINYDDYIALRKKSIHHQTRIAKWEKREYDKQVEKLDRIKQKVEYQQNNVSRSDPHKARVLKKKMHSLKSQEKKLDNVELTELPDVEESINFFFEEMTVPKNKIILKLDIPKLMVDDKILAKNIKLDIVGNVHMCIIGKNGVGKTTLIKQIYNMLKTRTDIKVGYMPQDYEDIFSNYENVLDFVASKNKDDITKARMYLGNMNFTRDEMTGKIKDLSNGTKAKLFLLKLVLEKCNVLILDEPTRNLSPLSNPVIRKVLRDFKGTIISISHDRKYISEVITDLYVLNKDGIIKVENMN